MPVPMTRLHHQKWVKRSRKQKRRRRNKKISFFFFLILKYKNKTKILCFAHRYSLHDCVECDCFVPENSSDCFRYWRLDCSYFILFLYYRRSLSVPQLDDALHHLRVYLCLCRISKCCAGSSGPRN